MARVIDGTSSYLKYARSICRIYGRFGVSALDTNVSPEFAAAVQALVIACQAFEAIDDYPGEIDQSGPIRPGEDVPPVV